MKTLIVDDEPLAREKLRGFLAAEPEVEVVGECRNGLEAVDAIERLRPDLVLLDVQMPELDGFAVIRALDRDLIPLVIFVTAFDQYALRAFEVHAVDYLLKPFDRARLRTALKRARDEKQKHDTSALNERLLEFLRDMRKDSEADGQEYVDKLVIKSSGRVFFLKVDEIDWVDSAGNYVRLHAGEDAHLLRETMNGLQDQLDPDRFMRIHRTTIVNVDRIRELQHVVNRDYVVILDNGQRLPLSRTYREQVDRLLGRTG